MEAAAELVNIKDVSIGQMRHKSLCSQPKQEAPRNPTENDEGCKNCFLSAYLVVCQLSQCEE